MHTCFGGKCCSSCSAAAHATSSVCCREQGLEGSLNSPYFNADFVKGLSGVIIPSILPTPRWAGAWCSCAWRRWRLQAGRSLQSERLNDLKSWRNPAACWVGALWHGPGQLGRQPCPQRRGKWGGDCCALLQSLPSYTNLCEAVWVALESNANQQWIQIWGNKYRERVSFHFFHIFWNCSDCWFININHRAGHPISDQIFMKTATLKISPPDKQMLA